MLMVPEQSFPQRRVYYGGSTYTWNGPTILGC